MFSRCVQSVCCQTVKNQRFIIKNLRYVHRRPEHPLWRTIRILKEDLEFSKYRESPSTEEAAARALTRNFPRHADIVIIGGGAVGSSIAYWLKRKSNFDGMKVVVIDKDPTYTKCTTALSMGGLKQQFSLPENIQMAVYGAEFLRTIKENFGPDAKVNFDPAGCLLLASEEGAPQLIDNIKLQQEYGTTNILLSKDQLQRRFPYLDVTDVEVGSLGLEREGWFNAWDMFTQLRAKAAELGTQYINAEVVDFLFEERADIVVDGMPDKVFNSTNELVIQLPNEKETRTIQFAFCIVAAGHESSSIAEKLGIGTQTGMLSVALPIEKRNRFIYSFNCEHHPPSINTPLIEDYSGITIRREGLGGSFLVGVAPDPDYAPPSTSEEDKTTFFNEMISPILSRRIPSFKDVKVTGSWSGEYEYNVYDGNGIIGPHPYFLNIYLATGFSDQGIQQAPAVGRAVAELIVDGNFRTIDLTRLGFDRLIVEKPMIESKVS